jgi:hypothetical protein
VRADEVDQYERKLLRASQRTGMIELVAGVGGFVVGGVLFVLLLREDADLALNDMVEWAVVGWVVICGGLTANGWRLLARSRRQLRLLASGYPAPRSPDA